MRQETHHLITRMLHSKIRETKNFKKQTHRTQYYKIKKSRSEVISQKEKDSIVII